MRKIRPLIEPEKDKLHRGYETYYKLIESIPYAIYILNSDARIIEVNEATLKTFGYSKDELTGTTPEILSATNRNSYSLFSSYFNESLKGTAQNFEYWGKRITGEEFLTETSLSALDYFGKKSIIAIVRDISKRKSAEEARKEAEQRFAQLISTIEDIFWLVDTEGRIIYINSNFDKIWGLAKNKVFTTFSDLFEYIHPEDIEGFITDFGENLNGTPTEREFRIILPDNRHKWLWNRAFPVRNIEDKVYRIGGVITDITEKKKLETSIRESEEINRTLVNNLPIGLVFIDKRGDIYYSNPAFCLLMGHSSIDCRDINISSLNIYADPVIQNYISLLLNKNQAFDIESSLLTNNSGQKLFLSIRGIPVESESSIVSNYLLLFGNITARKQMEIAHKMSEEKYRQIVEISQDGIAVFNKERKVTFLNQRMSEMFGFQESAMLGRNIFEFIFEKDRNKTQNGNNESLGILEPQSEIRFRKYDGTELFTITSLAPLFDKDGSHTGFLAMFTDITERKKAMELVTRSEEKFRGVFSQSPIGIQIFDARGIFVSANNACLDLLGIEKEEDLKGFNLFNDPNISKVFLNQLLDGEVIRTELLYSFDIVRSKKLFFTDKTGYKHFDTFIVPLKTTTQITGYLVQLHDISARIDAEESAHKLNLAFEQSIDGIALTDLNNRILFANRAWAEMHGYHLSEIADKMIDEFFESPHSEIISSFSDSDYIGIKERELKNKKKDGAGFYTRMTTTQLKDLHSNPIGFINIARDISEQKKTEQVDAAIYQISEAMLSTKTLEELYLNIHRIIGDLMPVQNFFIALYDPKADYISFPYFKDEKDLNPTPRPFGKGMTEYVIKTGKTQLITSATLADLLSKGEVEVFGSRFVDWLGVPLKSGTQIKGVIALQSYDKSIRYGEREKLILDFVSDQIVLAIGRKQSEESLHQTEEMLRKLIENSEHIITIQDVTGKYLYYNGSLFYGLATEQVINKYPEDFYIPEYAETIKKRIATVLETGETITVQESVKWAGKSQWFITHLYPVKNLQGNIMAVGTLGFNITEIKKAELRLKQSESNLKESNLIKDIIFSIIEHDIYGPIGATKSILDRLIIDYNQFDEEEHKNILKTIKETSNSIFALIDNMLNWAKSLKSEIGFHPKQNLILTIVNDCLSLLSANARNKNIRIVSTVDPDLTAYFDKNMITTVVRNLISNALKFTYEGGVIGISASSTDKFVTITIQDNGTGISKDNIAKLFQINKHFSTFGTNREEGTGLGLILCKNFIKLNDGEIWVESEPGKGSKFHFTLPAAHRDEIESTNNSDSIIKTHKNWKNKEILISSFQTSDWVDLIEILQKTGIKIHLKSNLSEAVEICKTNKGINLALIEVDLSRKDELQAIEQIRSTNKSIVLLAAAEIHSDEETGNLLGAGCDDCIPKPFKTQTISQLLSFYFNELQ